MAIQAQLYPDSFGFSFVGSQDFLMENACGFDHSLSLIPHQQQHPFLHFDHFQNFPQQKNPNFLVENNDNSTQFHPQQSMAFPQIISAQIEKQGLEFEQFINLQNERLRIAMQEQRKQQTSLLMKKYESKTNFLLKQKDEEITKAANRTVELQNILKRMEIENQTWERAAKENQAMVASLNGAIQRLRETVCLSANAAEDAESCCQNIEDVEEKTEETRKMLCKCCNSRSSCVVMLPCRHLCCCRDCEVFLDSCPVCGMPKKASMEALF